MEARRLRLLSPKTLREADAGLRAATNPALPREGKHPDEGSVSEVLSDEPSTDGLTPLLAGSGKFAVLTHLVRISRLAHTRLLSSPPWQRATIDRRFTDPLPLSTISFSKRISNFDGNELAMLIRGGSSLLSILEPGVGPFTA